MPYHYETEGPQKHIRVVAENKDLPLVFADSARGLWNLIVKTIDIRGNDRIKIVIDAPTIPKLFQAWLEAVLERADIEGLVLNEFRVATIQKLDDGGFLLTGEAFGEPTKTPPHKMDHDPKTLKPTQAKCTEKEGSASCSFLVA